MHDILKALDISDVTPGGFCGEWIGSADKLDSISPVDGKRLASVTQTSVAEYERVAARAHEAFLSWRMRPAPQRPRSPRTGSP